MWMPVVVNVRQAQPIAAPWYPADLLPEIQDTLRELADLDFRYEAEQESVLAVAAPGPERQRCADRLERRHGAERERLTARLADLQQALRR